MFLFTLYKAIWHPNEYGNVSKMNCLIKGKPQKVVKTCSVALIPVNRLVALVAVHGPEFPEVEIVCESYYNVVLKAYYSGLN